MWGQEGRGLFGQMISEEVNRKTESELMDEVKILKT
jgi:hypothetical protein